MGNFKKFNKFGTYGTDQLLKRTKESHFDMSKLAEAQLALLETARKQIMELDTMGLRLPGLKRTQLSKIKLAFSRQGGVLSEGQLRWLNSLYDERNDSSVRTEIPIGSKNFLDLIKNLKKPGGS